MTTQLLKANPLSMTCIEFDESFKKHLLSINSTNHKVDFIFADALKIDEYHIMGEKKFSIISNLPYNTSSHLIIKWVKDKLCKIQCMVLVIQKEVAEKITSNPGDRYYDKLSILVNIYYNTELLFDIPPESFTPKPKVWSSVIRLTPKKKYIIEKDELDCFLIIVNELFSNKRKIIRKKLQNILNIYDTIIFDNLMKKFNIDPLIRPNELLMEQLVRIYAYKKQYL